MFYLLILLLQMKLIRKIDDLNKAIKNEDKLGFIPTMGSLHKGHVSLIEISKKKCKKTLVSIFINLKQFNNKNDYLNYPRNLERDLKILKKLKVDYVFLPSHSEIYKKRSSIKFKLKKSQRILCAKHRKNHFEGVLDVMDRFVKLILPKKIFMGEKDFQQFFLVKSYIESIYISKIELCKTIRNSDKVALSSRNSLLNKNSLISAGIIAKKMINLKYKINKNKKKAQYFINNFKKELLYNQNINIEYLEARNLINLNTKIHNNKYKLFIAYYLNKVRLIDNF